MPIVSTAPTYLGTKHSEVSNGKAKKMQARKKRGKKKKTTPESNLVPPKVGPDHDPQQLERLEVFPFLAPVLPVRGTPTTASTAATATTTTVPDSGLPSLPST